MMRWLGRAVAVTLCFCLTTGQEGPVVDTIYGQVQGLYKQDETGKSYEEYLGIPFAKPPVGDLRWQKPVPPDPWDGVLNADKYSAHCLQAITPLYLLIQMGGVDSEDCLYLNVYVPQGVSEVSNLPVMVFIYGGGYNLGTTEMYPGDALAVHGDVIVVNMNYRVGVMGFLTTGDSISPGNYGLFDQALALQWVQDNIANFGGDPSRVTIFGQSAGGSSVAHCMISPYSRDLFQRGIAISGANYRNFTLRLRHRSESTHRLAEQFSCPHEDNQEMMDCLIEIDGHELDRSGVGGWGPVLDYDFIPEEPSVLWDTGIPKNHDLISGATDHDSAGFVINNPIALPIMPDFISNTFTIESTRRYVEGKMSGYTTDSEGMANLLYQRYLNMDHEDYETRTLATTLFDTDYSFGAQENKIAEVHSSYNDGTGNSYYYIYKHRHSFLTAYPNFVNASHLDDIYSVLGESFFKFYREFWLGMDYDEVDLQVKNDIMDYYTNFAYTGNPNQGPKEVGTIWPQYDTQERNHLVMANPMTIESLSQTLVDNYHFWIDIWPKLLVRDPQTMMNKEKESEESRLIAMVKELVKNPEGVTADDVIMLIESLSKSVQ